MTLHISPTLDLPVDILTESNAVLAKKGAGKTNGGVVIVEEAFAAGVPVVVIDPKGDWYGIRSGANGSPKGGLPLPVFGGLHGDIPLEPTAGAYIADLVRERGLSLVLDVSEFDSNSDRRRFLTAFADRLYKRPERDPMHLMLEEAHEYIPQGVSGEDAKMVGVFERLVKLGRYKGIGITMMTQRSASLNKNVLTQVDNLFMLRTGSPQDRAAVQAWIAGHGEAKEIIESLPSLATGEFWLWQPEHGEPVRARFRMRSTYDAGATPKIGEAPRKPATLADVDLTVISSAMAATIEKAKAEDPKALRLRIAELERELLAERARPTAAVETVEVSAITDEDRTLLTNQANLLHQSVLDLLRTGIGDIGQTVERLYEMADPSRSTVTKARIVPPEVFHDQRLTETEPRRIVTEPGKMPKAERSILTVLAQRGTQTRQQIATLAGYSNKGGGFNNAVSALRTAGYIESTRDPITATAEGLEALGDYEPLPTGRALIDFWVARFGKAEGLILEALVEAYPDGMTREDLAATTGYTPTGGGFNNSVSKLRALALIRGDRYGLFAHAELGEAGRP